VNPAQHPRGGLLEVPSVLYGQAQAHGHGRPGRALPAEIQASDHDLVARASKPAVSRYPPVFVCPSSPSPPRGRGGTMLFDKLRPIEERSNEITRLLSDPAIFRQPAQSARRR